MKRHWKSMMGVLVCVMFFQLGMVTAQTSDVTAFWEMDVPPEGGWMVGDLIPLRLRVISPADMVATLPELPEQWGTFEIREQSIASPEKSGDRNIAVLVMTIQIWEPGIHGTPPTTVTLQVEGLSPLKVIARPLRVDIASILPADGDEEALAKRDLKPQADLPRPPLWPWILAAICSAPLLFMAGRWLWYKIPRRSKLDPSEIVPVKQDSRSPEDIAYTCLEDIAKMDLPGVGAFKQHYSMVSECVRVYLEGVYALPAMDMTTTELKWALRMFKIDAEALCLLWNLLEHADMVKFAKLRPDVAQAQGIVSLGRHFVDVTKPQRRQDAEIIQDGGA